MHWPFAVGSIEHDKLPEALLDTARLHAHRAIRHSLDTLNVLEQIDQAISIGATIELLAKSVLADLSVQLLAANNSRPESVLTFAGKLPVERFKLPNIRTISGPEALEKLSICFKTFTVAKETRESIFRVRDSAAHMGLVDKQDVDRAMADLIAVSENILKLQGTTTSDDYWGEELLDIVNSIKERREQEIGMRYQALLISARSRFNLRWPNVEEPTLIAIESIPPRMEDDQVSEPNDCPACERKGAVVYEIERSEVLVDDSEQLHGVNLYVTRKGLPQYFICNVCELAIIDDAMLNVAVMDIPLDLGP